MYLNYKGIYREMLKENISESNFPAVKLLNDWGKKYIKTSDNPKKVKMYVDGINNALQEQEIDINKITSFMLSISKFVSPDASDALANVLEKI